MKKIQRLGIGLFILASVIAYGMPAFAESAPSGESGSKASADAGGKGGSVQCPPGMAPAGTASGSPETKQPDGTNPCIEPSGKGAAPSSAGSAKGSSGSESSDAKAKASPGAGSEATGKGGSGETHGG